MTWVKLKIKQMLFYRTQARNKWQKYTNNNAQAQRELQAQQKDEANIQWVHISGRRSWAGTVQLSKIFARQSSDNPRVN